MRGIIVFIGVLMQFSAIKGWTLARNSDRFVSKPQLLVDDHHLPLRKWVSSDPPGIVVFKSGNNWVEEQDGEFADIYAETKVNDDDHTVILTRLEDGLVIKLTLTEYLWGVMGEEPNNLNAVGSWQDTTKSSRDGLDDGSEDFIPIPEPTPLVDDHHLALRRWVSSDPPGIVVFKATDTDWIEEHNGVFFATFTQTQVNDDEHTVVLVRSDGLVVKLTLGEFLWGEENQEPTNLNAVGSWQDSTNDSTRDGVDDDDFDDGADDNVEVVVDQDDSDNSDSDMSVAEKAEKCCRKTCEKKGFKWMGLWHTEDGKCVKSCRCQNPNGTGSGPVLVKVASKNMVRARDSKKLTQLAKKICPKTCKDLRLTWNGKFVSKDGKTIFTCECVKKK